MAPPKQLQSWNAHLSKVRTENPKRSLKAAMKKASASYKKAPAAKKPKYTVIVCDVFVKTPHHKGRTPGWCGGVTDFDKSGG